MSDTAWGVIFIVYILAALPIMSMGNGDATASGGFPGSMKTQFYEARNRRQTKWGLAWAAGLVALIAAWAYL